MTSNKINSFLIETRVLEKFHPGGMRLFFASARANSVSMVTLSPSPINKILERCKYVIGNIGG